MAEIREPIRLGYACINTVLREDDIFSSRGIRLENVAVKGVVELQRLSLENIEDTASIIRWNEENGIRSFRLTSVLLPHFTNPRTGFHMTMNFAHEALRKLGDLAKGFGHRITMHPDHFSYTIVSTNPQVVTHAIADLNMHADILDAMGMGPDSVMCIHGPGTQDDRDRVLKEWDLAVAGLPERTRNRLVLENDEYKYGAQIILETCERNNIPMVFDWFHNSVSKERVEVTDEFLRRVLTTWTRRGIRPLFHMSDQAPGERVGTHAGMVESLPPELISIPEKFGIDIDIDIEAKRKEQAVISLYTKYAVKSHSDGRVVWRWKK